MPLRALIVLLLAMNLGIALWWALWPSPLPEPLPQPPAGVPALQLLAETQVPDVPEAGNEATPADAGEIAGDAGGIGPTAVCFSLGPYASADEVAGVRDVLPVPVLYVREREVMSGTRGWRVQLPPLANREAARAVASRLAEAGFNDHFIVAAGEETNAVALGHFGNETAARRHEAALRDAGFEAVAEPLGTRDSEYWLDLAAEAGFDAAAARQATGAARADPLDCAGLQ